MSKLQEINEPEKINFLIEASRRRFINYCQFIDPNYHSSWFHEHLADLLEGVADDVAVGKKRRIILTVPPRHGKELLSTTPILTTKGWKQHGELKIGDYVFHPSGKPTQVVNTIPQKQPATMKVTMTDGSFLITHGNHEWTIHDTRKKNRPLVTLETKEIKKALEEQESGKRGSRYFFQLPHKEPLRFPTKKTSIDPYVLGLWLGDGTQGDTAFTFNQHEEEELNAEIENSYPCSWRWVHSDGTPRRRYRSLKKDLKRVGVWNNKHLPSFVFVLSIEQRLAVLQGLLDSDGSIGSDNRVRFVNTNKDLISGIETLLHTFGIRTTTTVQFAKESTSGIVGTKDVYTVSFSPNNDTYSFFRLAHKKRKQRKSVRRKIAIASVERVKGGKGECITVDSPDGLYLAGEALIPTHNTHTAAELWPTWTLGKYPQMNFILSTYGSDLAERIGLAARDIVNHPHYQAVYPNVSLRKDVKSKRKWKTNKGGSYTGVGIGGAITGIGGDIILVDDPHKSREDAESELQRQRVREYFKSTLYSRLQGGGAIVLIMQRWHEDDLVSSLLEQQKEAEEAGLDTYDTWEVINFPAIAEEDEYINNKLLRKEGEPLWPEAFSVEDLHNIRNNIGIYNFVSQYQQNPIAVETQEFDTNTFRYFDEKVLEDTTLRYYTIVDPAIGQKSTSDNSVVVTLAKSPLSPNIYRVREDAGKYTPTELINLIFKHAEEFQSSVFIESVAFQKMLHFAIDEEQRKREKYFTLHEFKPTGNKEGRIRGLIPLYDRGVIFHRRSDKEYEQELLTFPRGRHDDRIDAMASGVMNLNRTRNSSAGKIHVKRFVGYFKNR